jgi:lipoprotein-anchoring transpeptidase ErfK/SrfK
MAESGIGRRRLLALGGLGAMGAVLAACSKSPSTTWNSGNGASGGPVPSGDASPTPSTTPTATGDPVHVRLLQGDGTTWGVGMPIIAYLSRKITNSASFNQATKVTVNGADAQGAWFFQNSAIYPDYPMEAHFRLQDYWPAHAQIHLDLPVQGLAAGTGLVFDDSLTLDIKTGAKNVVNVDGSDEKMIVTSDDQTVFTFPVSLGKASTPTFNGIKIVMEKKNPQRMVNTTPGEAYDVQVPWSVRLTNSGEFIHSASWNGGNIGQRSTSHGCTNLTDANAKSYYAFAQIGDVTHYINTGGPTMPSWDGYGDWNLDWGTWQRGGAVQAS